MPLKTLGVIPARFGSTRFPGKPLAKIGNRTMIEWTYVNSKKSTLVDELLVATDDKRILEVVQSFGGKAIMTSPEHPTGTDRLIEVAQNYPQFQLILNIQGDEPGIEPELLDGVIGLKLKNPSWEMATACVLFSEEEDKNDPNRVKVVFDRKGEAKYFSRSTIPLGFKKSIATYRHLGIYIYNRDFLLSYNSLPASEWEEAESLEQLRALQNGFKIGVFVANKASLAVDTPEDLEIVKKDFAKKGWI